MPKKKPKTPNSRPESKIPLQNESKTLLHEGFSIPLYGLHCKILLDRALHLVRTGNLGKDFSGIPPGIYHDLLLEIHIRLDKILIRINREAQTL